MKTATAFRAATLSVVAVLSLAAAPLLPAADQLAELEAAVTANPADAKTTADLGASYRAAKEAGRGVAFFEAFHAKNPPNSMSLVWQGSLKCTASAAEPNMEERLNKLQAGIGDMDKAVKTFPDNPRVRVVRGVTISFFPAFLGMSARAIGDLEGALKTPDELGSPAVVGLAKDGLARAYRQAGRNAEADSIAPGTKPN